MDAGAAPIVLRRHREPQAGGGLHPRCHHGHAARRGLGVRWRDIDFNTRRLQCSRPCSPWSTRSSSGARRLSAANARSRSMTRRSRYCEAIEQPSDKRSSPVHPDYFSRTFDRGTVGISV